MTKHELSDPHNWCDRCCEACPLAEGCGVAQRCSDEDPGTALIAALQEAVRILEAEAGPLLLDAEPVELPKPSFELELELLDRAAADYAHRLGAVDIGLAVLVRGKVARVIGELCDADDVVWAVDTAPNLILLELLLNKDATRALEAHHPALAEHGRRLRLLLAPLFAKVPASTREALAALRAAGLAPSPFICRSPGAPPAAQQPEARQGAPSERC